MEQPKLLFVVFWSIILFFFRLRGPIQNFSQKWQKKLLVIKHPLRYGGDASQNIRRLRELEPT